MSSSRALFVCISLRIHSAKLIKVMLKIHLITTERDENNEKAVFDGRVSVRRAQTYNEIGDHQNSICCYGFAFTINTQFHTEPVCMPINSERTKKKNSVCDSDAVCIWAKFKSNEMKWKKNCHLFDLKRAKFIWICRAYFLYFHFKRTEWKKAHTSFFHEPT